MRKFLRIVAWGVAALFFCVVSARAQNATLTGTVMDASGAPVAGANVSIKSPQTGTEHSITSNETGAYRIVELQPGHYDVTIEKAGFKTLHYGDVVLTVSQILTIDAKLEITTQSTTIEVSGQTVIPIELDNASISNVVDERHITDLPLITRDPYQLVLLSPGVIQSNTSNGGFSVNGQRDRNNNFLLDGVDNNDTDVPGIPSGITVLNPDATQEFRVITNNFLPEYGRNTGAIIEVITKSGANALHGDAYWFGRYNATAARDFFNHNIDNLTGTTESQNPFVRNIFGGSASGPIIKDKTFWFANYDGSRFVTTLTNQTTVPTSEFKTGVFTFNGTPVDISSPASPQNATGLPLDATVAGILALYPPANAGATAVDDVRGLYRFGNSSRSNSDNFTTKVDHKFNDNQVLYVRYIYNRFTDPNPFHSDFLPGLDAVGTYQRTQNLAIGLTSTLNSRLVNEFHLGGNRTHLDFTCAGISTFDGFGPTDPFGRGIDYSLAGLNNFGCGTLGDSNGQSRFTGTYPIADSLSWIHSNHNVKFGATHSRVYSNSFNAFGSRTADSFNVFSTFGVASINLDPTPGHECDNAASNAEFVAWCGSTNLQNMGWMLTGVVDSQFQGQFFNKAGSRTANDLRGFRQRELRLFAQDAWKIKPNITLSYGLAWQYYGVPFEVNNNFSNLFQDPSGPAPFTFSIVGPGTHAQVFDDYYKNFEPRIGVAWDPTKSGKMSVRAGYGIFHDRVFGNLVGNARGNPPFEQDSQTFPGDLVENVGLPGKQTPSATIQDETGITPILFDKKFRTPETQSWNLGIQREWLANTTVEVDYVGSHSTHLFREVDGNPPQPDLVAQLVAFCSDPSNAFGCSPSTLQFSTLWFGADFFGNIPFNAVNNNAFFQAFLQKSIANASYHGLQVKVSQKMWHGLQIGGAYTFSHAIDDASDPLTPAAGNRGFPRNSFNLRAERGNSDFDVHHRGVINYLYEVPFGRGKAHLNVGFLGKALEGWQLSGITTFSTGLPYDVFGNRDNQHTGLSDRAELLSTAKNPSGTDKTVTGPPLSDFGYADCNTASNLGRNHFYGPDFIDFDSVVQKTTTITERTKLVFRTEAYNLFNHANFGQPGNSIANPGTFGTSLSQIGRADGTSGARQLQFALKLLF